MKEFLLFFIALISFFSFLGFVSSISNDGYTERTCSSFKNYQERFVPARCFTNFNINDND